MRVSGRSFQCAVFVLAVVSLSNWSFLLPAGIPPGPAPVRTPRSSAALPPTRPAAHVLSPRVAESSAKISVLAANENAANEFAAREGTTDQSDVIRPFPPSKAGNPSPKQHEPFGDSKSQTSIEPGAVASVFIENRGQFDERVKFQLRGNGKTVWLTNRGIVFDSLRAKVGAQNSGALPSVSEVSPLDRQPSRDFERLVFSQDFVDALPTPTVEPFDIQPGKYNYLVSSDTSKWHTGVRAFAGVVYRNVWDGIDVKVVRNGPNIEQEFVVHPGADLSRVQLAYRGIDGLEVAKDGSLVVHTAYGDLQESAPRIYQEIAGNRVSVAGRFKLTNENSYTFKVESNDPQYALVIDPTLLYSTFLGGSVGFGCGPFYCATGESALAIAVDAAGNAYVTGFTQSLDFPTTPGAFQTSTIGISAFVTKLNATGSQLVYSTYLAASGGSQATYGQGISLDSAQEPYITGTTGQGTFPTTSNAYEQACPSGGSFLTKMNATGDGLIYSTCFGLANDSFAYAIAVDSSGKAFITGSATTGLPTTPGAYQPTYAGAGGGAFCCDAFLSVFDPSASGAASLVYSTYLGGSNDDQGYAVSVDAFGMAYVTGSTSSQTFPVTQGAFQTNYPGAATDVFVAKFNPSASGAASLIYSTYLGGNGIGPVSGFSGQDVGRGIAVDALGQAHVTGATGSANFPVIPGAFQATSLWVRSGFISTLNTAGNRLVQSTFLGGSSGDQNSASAIALDSLGNAYVTGTTGAADFPTTADAFQPSLAGPLNAFVTKLNPAGTGLVYSSYLGGSKQDQGYGIAVDPVGDAYVTGFTESVNFPTTPFAFQPKINPGGAAGPADAFATKFPLGGQLRLLQVSPSAGGNSGSVTITIFGGGLHNGLGVTLREAGQPDITATSVNVQVSGRIAVATFDLQTASARPGLYDLVATNPDGSSFTLPASFTVQEGGAPDIQVQVLSTFPLIGSNVTFMITVSNGGNIDAKKVNVLQYLDPWFQYVSANPPPDGITDYFPQDALGKYEALQWDPHLPPSQSFTFTFNAILSPVLSPHTPIPLCTRVGFGSVPSTATLTNCGNNLLRDLAAAEAGCLGHTTKGTAAYAKCVLAGAAAAIANYIACIYGKSLGNLGQVSVIACGNFVAAVFGDPNNLAGSTGVGVQRWVSGAHPMQYGLSFQNEPTATAPVQKVVVTNPIDADLDLTTIQLTSISLAGVQVPIAPTFLPAAGLDEFATNVDLRPLQELLINIDAKLDPLTRVLTWTFTSIDPATGQPPSNPQVGFLPPNGDGALSFTVNPLSGLSTGTLITDQASVVFTPLAPVATLPWTNTIDNTPPASRVTSLPSTETSTSFTVAWSGTDVGSGIQDFTVFASDNGGPFTALLTNTTATSTTFTGQLVHTYSFYTIARDLVGNVEPAKTAAEATTTVSVPPPDYTLSTSTSTLTMAAGQSGTATITVTPQGYSGAVNFSCGTLPSYITCTFSPSNSVNVSTTGPTTVQVNVHVAATVSMLKQGRFVLFAMALPLGLFGFLPAFGGKRMRRFKNLAVLMLAISVSGIVSGCNTNSSGSTAPKLPPPGTQTITLTASGSGGISHQIPLQVIITN